MPILGPASFVPTTEEFLNHWKACNEDLPADEPLVLSFGGETVVPRAGLEALRDELEEQRDAIQGLVLDIALAYEQLADDKRAALARLNLFNDKVRATLGGSAFDRALPRVPPLSGGDEVFHAPMGAAARIWLKVNARPGTPAPTPLTLRDGTSQADFAAAVESIRAGYAAVRDLETDLKLMREQRGDVEDKIQPILKKYRQTVPTRFAESDALVETLPILTPAGGHTPAAPKATGSWNAATQRGELEFTPISDAAVKEYQLRWAPGAKYATDDESTLETIKTGEGTKFETTQGLETPGSTALFRVVVVLSTGNEAGSEPVAIVRPAA